MSADEQGRFKFDYSAFCAAVKEGEKTGSDGGAYAAMDELSRQFREYRPNLSPVFGDQLRILVTHHVRVDEWPFDGENPLETVARLMREKNELERKLESFKPHVPVAQKKRNKG
jgi:hypothetical protein